MMASYSKHLKCEGKCTLNMLQAYIAYLRNFWNQIDMSVLLQCLSITGTVGQLGSALWTEKHVEHTGTKNGLASQAMTQ